MGIGVVYGEYRLGMPTGGDIQLESIFAVALGLSWWAVAVDYVRWRERALSTAALLVVISTVWGVGLAFRTAVFSTASWPLYALAIADGLVVRPRRRPPSRPLESRG
jgi:hypothetical protein